MARFKTRTWLIFAAFFFNVYGVTASEGSGFAAVLESDQEMQGGYYEETVKNWVHSGRPGLFMTEDFNKTENSTFTVNKDGVYYVTVYLVIETKRQSYSYSNTVTLSGKIELESDNAYVPFDKHLRSYVTMQDNEQNNLRIAGYVQLEAGWHVSVTLDERYSWYSRRWKKTIKAGSTFSMMYVSSSSMFPGVLLKNNYEYVYLESPSYSAAVVNWYEIDEGTAFPTSEGNVIVPHDGLYHVMVNLVMSRYSDIELKFCVMINNKTEAITKTTVVESAGTNVITLEGILNLNENQIISITISNPASQDVHVYVSSGSTFFIFSKGALKPRSTPAFAITYKSSSAERSANKFSILKNWDTTTSKDSLDHYGSVQLKQGEFVSPKQGIYQINFALYISNCSDALARLSLKPLNEKSYQAVGPDVGFTQETSDCYLENSWLLELNTNDTLRLEVKSDMNFAVLPQTSYQLIYLMEYSLWPSAIFELEKSFKFNSNTPAVKVHDWSHHTEGNWNDLFFNVYKERIVMKIPGLYLISYNLVVKTSSNAPFYSQILKNGTLVVDGSLCKRGTTPQMFTCTSSTLFNLIEKDSLAIQVWMKDSSKKQSVEILTPTRLTISLLGDTRSSPSFKLNTQTPSAPYTTKATKTVMKSLNDFTFPNTSFFQSSALYSKSAKAFSSGNDYGFVLLNNLQFDLQNDGYLASVVGAEDSSMTVYSRDHKTSHFSLSASELNFGSQFYFNVSGEAKKSDLKWQPETGSVVSGVGIGKSGDVTFLKAQLRPKGTLKCSSDWKLVGVSDWKLGLFSKNFGKITSSGIQITSNGFYLTTLNFAMTSNNSNTVIDVGIFIDQENELTARETSPTDGKFSLFLQGVLEVRHGQDIDVKVRCAKPTTITYAKGGGIFALKVDKPQVSSGMRKRLIANYKSDDEIGTYYPRYSYQNNEGFEEFQIGITKYDWQLTVPRNGLYLIIVVGHTRHAHENLEIAFSSPANDSKTAACSLNTAPLYYQTTSNHLENSIALTGFALLNTDEISGFVGQYDNWGINYQSRLYMSMQYVGDVDTSSAFAATLKKDVTLKTGKNVALKEKSWTSDKNCGKFSSRDVPTEFDKYGVSYTGYYLVSINFVAKHKDGCNFKFCFTINGKEIQDARGSTGLNVGCFQQYLRSENETRISTVSGSELLYLEEGNKLSIQMDTTCDITISKKSSFSVFYLGTAGALLGFSSILLDKGELRELPSLSSRYYYRRHYYDDGDYTQFVIGGWKMALDNSKMFFDSGLFKKYLQKTAYKDIFICPQDGIYMVVVKVNAKGDSKMNETCNMKLELAVDGEVLDFAFKRDLIGSVNTLSFTTTLRLEKWQGVTVRLSSNRLDCSQNMTVETGSSLAMVYLDSGKDAFTLWPNIGPHIIEFPGIGTVYVREDHTKTAKVTCSAVGQHDIKYQWKTYNDKVVSESSELDTRKLNDSRTEVKCVAIMDELIAETNFVTIRSIDPTIVFGDTYDNRTYDLPEKNETTGFYDYQDVLILSAKEKKPGYYYYYYWYWSRRISCKITAGNENGTFSITRYYGGYGDDEEFFKLRARLNKLDREAKDNYDLEITCENIEYEDAVKAKTIIKVLILDANDNLPVFEKEFYETTVKKNIRTGEDIIQVQATDDDINENGKIVYSLRQTVTSYIFRMDPRTGVISLKDKEQLTDPVYTLTAIAKDKGRPPRRAFVTVQLKVEDVLPPSTNDTNKNPVFRQKTYTTYLAFSAPKGTPVTTIRAYDPHSQRKTIIYFIVDGDISVFGINRTDGEIKTKAALKQTTYNLTIAAGYQHTRGDVPQGKYSTTRVIVHTYEVDPSRPSFERPHYEHSIPEDTQKKVEILKVKAMYPQKVIYSIPTKGVFEIDKESGWIVLAGQLDYEKERNHSFVVSARDVKDKTKSACTDVTIHVTDVNDNAPVFEGYEEEYKVNVEMGKNNVIAHFHATDRDEGTNGEIRYYLVYDYGLFCISNVNGTLYRKGNLSCCNHYFLEIMAKDQGQKPLEARISIEIIPQPTHPGHTSPHKEGNSSSQKKYIIIGVVGGLAIILLLVGVLYWLRRRRRSNDRNSAMNYIGLPTDEEDDPLLDTGSDHDDDTDERRLSLISSASDDNLLRNEAPC